MQIDLAKAKELFLEVLEKPAHERVAYLDTACAGDSALRQRVEAMLQTHENSGELLPRTPGEMLADANATAAGATAAESPQSQGPATSVDHHQLTAEALSFLTPTDKPGRLGRLGHYEVQDIVGKGGFGTVFKAFDEKLHRVVAIKVLSPAFAANGAARARFIREARTAAAVKNDHVVAIYGVEDEAQPPYLVMELIDGVSLQDKIDKKGPLSLRGILRIGLQTAEGLAAAHKQGLVHRDIKPSNILLENGVERVKITDFGLARAVDDASVTQSGTVAGTPMYMSPEQAEGVPIDHRSDLFSLGTVLYAMCTGHPPFRASGTHAVLKRVIEASPRPMREIDSEIPDWLCDIVAKLHAKKPEDRYQTANEVAELLGQHLSDVQAGRAATGAPGRVTDRSEPTNIPVAPPVASPAKRGIAFALPWVGGAIAVALVILAVALANKWKHERDLANSTGHVDVLCEGRFLQVDVTSIETGAPAYSNSTGQWPAKGLSFALPPGSYKLTAHGDSGKLGQPGEPVHEQNLVVTAGETQTVIIPEWGAMRFFCSDDDLQMTVNGEAWTSSIVRGQRVFTRRLPKGKVRWSAAKDGKVVASGEWQLRGGEDKTEVIPPVAGSGWVSLFDGKGFAGWFTPDPGADFAGWSVKNWGGDGTLLPAFSVSNTGTNFLITERNDYTDFHLRAVMYARDTPCGIFFRCDDYVPDGTFPAGYEAVVGNQPYFKVGSLRMTTADSNKPAFLVKVPETKIRTYPPPIIPKDVLERGGTISSGPDTSFRMDVIARGNHIVIKINDEIVADYTDPKATHRKGRIALYGGLWFNKLEIKLPREDKVTQSMSPKG